MKAPRRAVRWAFAALVPAELLLVLCVAGGVRPAPAVRLATESAVLALAAASTTVISLDHRRHRRGFLFVCVVETVGLAFLIPWPVVHAVTLVLDIWGCYFVIALHASCVVRPHVAGADGSLRLRYGALLDIRIPAGRIASVRLDRAFPDGKPAVVGENGVADMAVAGQTSVTVGLTEPVRYLRALGKPAEARAFRFYAEDPASTVAALKACAMSAGQ